MQITINGEPTQIDADTTLDALVRQFDLSPQRVAIEVNEQIVKRAVYPETTLNDGDRVEIVTLVGGG